MILFAFEKNTSAVAQGLGGIGVDWKLRQVRMPTVINRYPKLN